MLSYLDAATGSMIVSAIAGGAAGLSVAGKVGMRRLKGKFGRSSGDVDESPDESGAETEEQLSAENVPSQ